MRNRCGCGGACSNACSQAATGSLAFAGEAGSYRRPVSRREPCSHQKPPEGILKPKGSQKGSQKGSIPSEQTRLGGKCVDLTEGFRPASCVCTIIHSYAGEYTTRIRTERITVHVIACVDTCVLCAAVHACMQTCQYARVPTRPHVHISNHPFIHACMHPSYMHARMYAYYACAASVRVACNLLAHAC